MDSSKKISMHKKKRLPHSSRVCDEVVEYYEKHAEDRDIIKYMRLSSCSSGASIVSSSSSTSGLDGKSLNKLFDSEVKKYQAAKSSSLPNVAVNKKAKEHIISITMESRSSKAEKENARETDNNFKTPQKETRSKETQTPESVTKNNKILEWDSLGDVGYIKSKSTSNISLLERSILKDVLQELSISGEKLNANSSEGNLAKLNENVKKDAKVKSKSYEQNLNSPLASSTLLGANAKSLSGDAQRKSKDVSTSTSYTNFLQKSVQTSLTRMSNLTAKEVQVNISPDSMGTTTTPSSIDYHTTRSSNKNVEEESTEPKKDSSTTKLTDSNVTDDKEDVLGREKERLTARLTEVIQMNAGNSENNNATTTNASTTDSIKFEEVRNTLRLILDDNTEASSSNTSITRSPQLDLGVKLLCSLIEAKSLDRKQKRKLLRDIVNKIIAMSSEGSFMQPYPTISSSLPLSVTSSQVPIVKSAPKVVNLHDKNKKIAETDLSNSTEKIRKSSGIGEKVIHTEVYEEPSKQSLQDQEQTESSSRETRPSKENENPKVVQSNKPVLDKAAKRNKKMISDSDTVPATTTASSRTSKDIITPKQTTNVSDSNTMGEWLNPLTQSEIEYEEKKRAKKLKKKPNVELDTERKVQLNWIDTEIERLECLRLLLLKQNSLFEASEAQGKTNNTESATTSKPSTEKFYDTVYSSGSKSSSEMDKCDGEESEEIDVILEVSNEDVLDKNTKVKYKRDRVRETQIVYDKSTSEPNYGIKTQGKPLYRTVKETVTTRMQQKPNAQTKRLTDTYKAPPQRSKIQTPSTSNEMETVDTYGQQRKQEFLDKYNIKKKHHYEKLVQQQQEQEMQLKDQKRRLQHQKKYLQQQQQQQQPNTVTNAKEPNNYYSVPHREEQKYSQHPQRTVQSNKRSSSAKPQRVIDDESFPIQNEPSSSTSIGYQQNSAALHSSSSVVISSSDYSVPMGSNTNTSTTTTTHQYDAVGRNQQVATIGVQTSNSLLGINGARSML
ncbi:uncharacterized protein DDB_G0284459-like [Teleopsis dalmanni]|uniref:uncharacterized protein DDB_G0284459-like n=1 Tax=Teleopsis dalmanni TaxID=139649 RepID=UPI0018CCA748|nr:uncharacterized protein DDB_G0284459-like [Teleopsis dalmanni]